ncbi:2-hydroxychromene-2-carboxylate isomerase [Microdochium trichocladiopsis]|uniref:Glutathione S-transferase kappa n=1 Tax=Microdochium trichocladiopsis TaxID=1682393 RepID=A0A9P8XXZ0_9PEZI|nr:2-hydroxychromene-2-carboxylate isomerase [Microdochium trichocladiopsis]KAH7021060.1 2-hydroxychromene-2-carboxylate isomerase [Microdochium trichocladiopsis]
MPPPKINLFFDIVSPFAYEAFHIIKHNVTFEGVELTLTPMFLGGLLKACGNSPPVFIKNKAKWITVERLRWARLFDIPMHDELVANFPPNTMHTMRALALIPQQDQEQLSRVVERLFHEFFVNRKAIETQEVFGPILREVLAGETAESVIQQADTEGKTALKINTDKAFETGAFGTPWFVCTTSDGKTDSFWGVDHLGQVADFLSLERVVPSRAWRAIM